MIINDATRQAFIIYDITISGLGLKDGEKIRKGLKWGCCGLGTVGFYRRVRGWGFNKNESFVWRDIFEGKMGEGMEGWKAPRGVDRAKNSC